MSAVGRWLRNLADTIDPQLPPTEVGRGLPGTEYRERLCQWVRANGLDPNDIPEDSDLVVADGMLTVDVVVRDARGAIVLKGNSVERTKKTVPLRVPWGKRDQRVSLT